jgi:5-methylcytosine-specific restriction endonuclease McrA
MKLLTRDEFREAVLKRDNGRCVLCGSNRDVSVHHILERKLWSDGGYYVENGATLCERHHMAAEKTLLECETIREVAHIETVALPPGFDPTLRYEKWGNIINPDGSRTKGPLFHDEGCVKMMKSARLIEDFK